MLLAIVRQPQSSDNPGCLTIASSMKLLVTTNWIRGPLLVLWCTFEVIYYYLLIVYRVVPTDRGFYFLRPHYDLITYYAIASVGALIFLISSDWLFFFGQREKKVKSERGRRCFGALELLSCVRLHSRSRHQSNNHYDTAELLQKRHTTSYNSSATRLF